jgi:hypothetical protein
MVGVVISGAPVRAQMAEALAGFFPVPVTGALSNSSAG